MPKRLDIKWDSLAPDAGGPVFQLFDATHPLPFYVGRESDGKCSLLLVCRKKPPSVDNLRSIRVSMFNRPDGKVSLVLTLETLELRGVFSLLCEDLIESSRHAEDLDSSIAAALRRLDKWRKLLETQPPSLLGESAIRGLFGELVILAQLMERFGPSAVSYWVGPLQADQDFQAAENAWEVKTIRPDADNVQIASERQLLSTGKSLYLVLVTLTEKDNIAEDAYGLNQLVALVRHKLVDHPNALDLFEDRLFATGYLSREEYDRPIFIVMQTEWLKVGDTFPRIVPNLVAAGVFDVAYKLSLQACRSSTTD